MCRDFSGHAGRRHDEPLVVAREKLAIYARFGVEPLRIRERRQLDEVAISDSVSREHDQVVIRLGMGFGEVARGSWPAPLAPVTGRDICFHPDNRLDASLLRLLLKLPRGM